MNRRRAVSPPPGAPPTSPSTVTIHGVPEMRSYKNKTTRHRGAGGGTTFRCGGGGGAAARDSKAATCLLASSTDPRSC